MEMHTLLKMMFAEFGILQQPLTDICFLPLVTFFPLSCVCPLSTLSFACPQFHKDPVIHNHTAMKRSLLGIDKLHWPWHICPLDPRRVCQHTPPLLTQWHSLSAPRPNIYRGSSESAEGLGGLHTGRPGCVNALKDGCVLESYGRWTAAHFGPHSAGVGS